MHMSAAKTQAQLVKNFWLKKSKTQSLELAIFHYLYYKVFNKTKEKNKKEQYQRN